MSVKEHYVYMHLRPDNGGVFYIGKGTSRKNGCRQRAHTKDKRNYRWRKTVAIAGGFVVKIVAEYDKNADALAAEQRLIKWFSRENLSNMTDGGEGSLGIEKTPETRAKLSAAASRPRGQKWVESIRRARKNGGNGGVVKKGDKLPEWWCDKISEAVQGERNVMYGRTGEKHPNAKAVVCTVTGERFPSVSAAAAAHGIKMKSLHNKLTGHRKNDTALRFEVDHAS